jgi:hypothetical protein
VQGGPGADQAGSLQVAQVAARSAITRERTNDCNVNLSLTAWMGRREPRGLHGLLPTPIT